MRLQIKLAKKVIAGLTIILIFNEAYFSFIPSSRAQTVKQKSANEIASPQEYSATAAMLEQFISREMADKRLPGIAVALVDDQKIVWRQNFGFADPQAKTPINADTVFRVGSVSKLFTDIAVMRLVEQKKLDLDAPVTKYLADFKPRNPFDKPVTLRQLMSHRAGLVREPPVGNYFDSSDPTLAETIKSLNQTALVYAPETRTKYSNAGIAAVGYVLEKTQKQLFADYLARTLLEPLGMRHSSFKPTAEIEKNLARARMWTIFGKTFDAPRFELGIAPAGSMYTTIGDLAGFASALFAADNAPNAILKKDTLEKMWTPQYAAPAQKSGFGLGFFVSDLNGHRRVGHGGAIYGFSTELSILPDDKLAVIAIATEDFTNGVTSRIADVALKAMLAERENKPIPQPEITSPIDAEIVKKIAGRYVGGDQAFDLIERADGNLYIMKRDGGFESRLRSLGDALVVDDKFVFGTRIVPSADFNGIVIEGESFKRVSSDKPAPAPEKWRALAGEYGPDYDPLYIFERDGKLWALIEQFEFNPLEQISDSIFKFPNHGLYDGERLVFKRDANGRATEVVAAGVAFKRRRIGPEEGAQQLKIKPVRAVGELIKEALAAEPPKETGDFRQTDLVELIELDPTIKLDVRYATTNNLFDTVFYSQPRAFLQREAGEALVRANRKLRERGYGLLVHDAYRPWYVTKVFWDATPDDKKIFVADPSQGSRHNRGAAVDLTLYDLKTGNAVEMVGTYDETTDRAYPDYPGGTSLQRWHRKLLRDAMESEGFTVYEAEWWHFDYKDWRGYRIGNLRFDQIR